MILDRECSPNFVEVGRLEKALSGTSLTWDDLEFILECELDTTHVLDYITAIRRNRMN